MVISDLPLINITSLLKELSTDKTINNNAYNEKKKKKNKMKKIEPTYPNIIEILKVASASQT